MIRAGAGAEGGFVDGVRKAGKRFFFGKKKQKTFIPWHRWYDPRVKPRVRFFCFFFSKKRSAAFAYR